MTINKYQGKTKEEAVEKAKQELGAGAVVLNVKEIKPKGMFKMFKNTLYEVTAGGKGSVPGADAPQRDKACARYDQSGCR